MHDELNWMDRQNADESAAKERYEYFTRPEPRENLSDIELIDDPYLGSNTEIRKLKIGMVRNAKDSDKMEVIAYLKPFPHIRIDKAKQLQGWYQSKINESAQSRPRPCFTEAVLTEPYGGYCAVGCQFCYINSGMRGYRGTGLISVPLDYGEQIRDQLKKVRRSAAGYFSSFTDPFTPLENYYHNTEEAANAFVELGLPIFFLSRLRYPDWAVRLLKKNPHSYAQKSINTSDREDWRKLSPGAMSLQGHLNDIRRLKKHGIYVSIQVNPIVPGVTSNEQIVELFNQLKKAGTDHVIVKFVEAAYSWSPDLIKRITKVFGKDRGNKFASLFTQNIGSQRTIDQDYRLAAHELFSRTAKNLGLTYATCYEYEYEKNKDGSIRSKTGISIGRKYTTADQCHGHRVPMYSRQDDKTKFKPIDECPPSGCLYCADENEGKPRCGDELAGEARAVRYSDMKIPIGEGKSSVQLIQLEVRK